MRIKLLAVGILITTFLTTGCITQRINQFETFAKAGNGYSEAIDALTVEAGNAAIDTDSQILMLKRDALDTSKRTSIYLANTKALRELDIELQKFRRHSKLLKRYFSSLEKLATSDAPAGIAEKSGEFVNELQKLSPDLKGAKFGNASVNQFVSGTVQFTVAAFQQAALEKELENNAQTIEREIDLQHAFLKALAIDLTADLEAMLNIKEFLQVAKPYKNQGKLPKNWAKTRREILTSKVMLKSVENAQNAAKSLRVAFIALVEKRIDPMDFEILFDDINAMIDLVELVRGNKSA